jgi:glycogen operon protein
MRQTAEMSAQSRPHPLGVHPRDGGVDVAVFAAHADRVQLCLLEAANDGSWHERRVDLPARTHGVWHGFVPEVPVGQRYGLRVHGDWNPRRGHRHNPAKLLLDPYARALVPPAVLRPELFGHPVGRTLEGNPRLPDRRDSAPFAAHGIVVDGPPRPELGSTRLRTPWTDTVIYEAHVRGLTRKLRGLPAALRGTYAGLAHPVTLEYLTGLGITAVELLPVHASVPEPHLVRRGLPNYWGYSTLGFFAPHLAYAAADDATAAVVEFRDMVAALHQAGLEVLLDVVYNHTCESGVGGPTLSFRGLDAATYYRLDGDGRDIDFTGCGNSLDVTELRVVQLVLDSLRYWVQALDVDGFRFDLAPTLARGHNEFYPDHPMLVAIRADPVLSDVKLIAEPWDVGPDGWQTGQFPPPFTEWNDRFRDDVRDFWLPGAARATAGESAGGLRDLGTRIAGSDDTFVPDRGPLASINFIAAHDGFTLADCTAYHGKHNLSNGEDNRDGTDNNRSWNHGIEGPTHDPMILSARQRSIRNLLGTLLFSAGVPMLMAGDEFGRTQQGNNNPYSQDNDLSWIDWQLEPWQEDLLTTTRYLLSLRKHFAAVRPEHFFTGQPSEDSAAPGLKDLAWFAPDGQEMSLRRWADWGLRTLQVLFADPALLTYPDAESDVATSVAHSAAAHSAGLRAAGLRAAGLSTAGLRAAGLSTAGLSGSPELAGSPGPASLLMTIAGASHREDVVLPKAPSITGYELLWDSSLARPPATRHGLVPAATTLTLPPNSLRLYRAHSQP